MAVRGVWPRGLARLRAAAPVRAIAILIALGLLLAGCTKTNNPGEKPPTYFVPPTAMDA